jgi:hypothetical protein
MLVVDIDQRYSASQCLEHPWFTEVLEGERQMRELHPDYMERLHEFVGMSRMKRLSLKLLSYGIRSNEMKELKVEEGRGTGEGGKYPGEWQERGRRGTRGLS